MGPLGIEAIGGPGLGEEQLVRLLRLRLRRPQRRYELFGGGPAHVTRTFLVPRPGAERSAGTESQERAHEGDARNEPPPPVDQASDEREHRAGGEEEDRRVVDGALQ